MVAGSVATMLSSCASTWTAGRAVGAEALACSTDELDLFVPHSYNLGAGDHVYRCRGRTVVVRCVTTPASTLCHPVSGARVEL